mmetsp:Transcript_82510/g.252131  ORF Transcript_82510/g.252131 Transcript_82510/m.252131 type:complete len:237 (-) Transcript_82510:819-1529(-)
MRKPRNFTWKSVRPKSSTVPSRQRPKSLVRYKRPGASSGEDPWCVKSGTKAFSSRSGRPRYPRAMKGPPKAISAGSRAAAARRPRSAASTALLPVMGDPADMRDKASPFGTSQAVISPSVGPYKLTRPTSGNREKVRCASAALKGSPQVITCRAGQERHHVPPGASWPPPRRNSCSSSSPMRSSTICKAEGTKMCAARRTGGGASARAGGTCTDGADDGAEGNASGSKAPQARRKR